MTMVVQRFNAFLLHGSLPAADCIDRISHRLTHCLKKCPKFD